MILRKVVNSCFKSSCTVECLLNRKMPGWINSRGGITEAEKYLQPQSLKGRKEY